MATNAVPTNSGGGVSKPADVRKPGIFRSPVLHRWLRTFHRATALIAGIFMAVVGITGVLISGEILFGPAGPAAHVGRGLFSSTLHFTLMDLHTFFIFGKGPGLAVELAVATALLTFCISGLWFYAVLFRQWLKVAVKENGGYSPSIAFRAANRFMARFVSVLLVMVLILALITLADYLIARPASLAARAAHLPPPPPSLAGATKMFFSLKADIILMAAASFAIIYFCVVGFWYSGLVFGAWRRSKAARAALPAEPAKAMRTIHRWLSVPFGLFMIVTVITGLATIPGLWGAGHLPWLSSSAHLENLKNEAIIARNLTLPPELRVAVKPLPTRPPNFGPGGGPPNFGPGGAPPNFRPGGPPPNFGPGGGPPNFGPGAMPNFGPGGTLPPGFAMKLPLYGRLSDFLKDVHSGVAFGTGGQIFVLLTGLALTLFSLSGIWMYVSMYFPRRKSGRKALFWH